MVGINSSGGSSILQRLLGKAQEQQNKSLKNLASGEKSFISDVAAGAIAEALEAEGASREVASRNIQDFASVGDLRNGAIEQIQNLQARQGELATQASNETYSQEQREVLNQEFQSLTQEIDRIAATTTFNGISLFAESSVPAGDSGNLTAQVGVDGSESSQITLSAIDISTANSPKSIATAEAARSALDTLKTEQTELSSLRAEDGAVLRRLDSAAESNTTIAEGLAAARSRLQSVDVAEESANLIRTQVVSNQAVAVSAQANQSAQTVLNLLR